MVTDPLQAALDDLGVSLCEALEKALLAEDQLALKIVARGDRRDLLAVAGASEATSTPLETQSAGKPIRRATPTYCVRASSDSSGDRRSPPCP